MKNALLVSCLLTLPLVCRAASKPDPLEDLIAKVVEQGQPTIEQRAMAEKLGFRGEHLISKTIQITPQKSGDGRAHYVSVIVHQTKDGREVPDALEMGSGLTKKDGDKLVVDALVFSADLKGVVQKAFHNSGLAHHLQSEELPTDSRKTRRLFQKELKFFFAKVK